MSDQYIDTRPGHSTGPRTAQGKENSCRNAATHGLSCKKFFLALDESEEDFMHHSQRWIGEYKEYSSPALDSLVEDLIQAHWLQKRAFRRISESESALAMAEANRDPAADEIFRRLRNMQRYKTSYETSFQRAFRAVEAFCKNRIAAKVAEHRIANIKHAAEAKSSKRPVRVLISAEIPCEKATPLEERHVERNIRASEIEHSPGAQSPS